MPQYVRPHEDLAYEAVFAALPGPPTPEQRTAIGALLDTYRAEGADWRASLYICPSIQPDGEVTPEFLALEAREAARRAPGADWDPGFRRFFKAFDDHPPEEVLEALRAFGRAAGAMTPEEWEDHRRTLAQRRTRRAGRLPGPARETDAGGKGPGAARGRTRS